MLNMKRNLAQQMVRAAFKASEELEQMLPTLKASCSEEEYRDLARGIAARGNDRGRIGEAL
jgi:hypothetical protein